MPPKEWRKLELQEIASLNRGKFSARPRNRPEYFGGEIPFAQTGDVANSNGRLEKVSQHLSPLGMTFSRTFPAATVLITIAANIGDVALTTFELACTDSVVGIIAKNGISTEWLLYTLQHHKQSLERLAPQNAQKNLSLERLRPFAVRVPPIEEQREIAAILSTWDRAIELTEKLIAAKQKRKHALMQQLLTGKVRFGEFVESKKTQESIIGDVPLDWQKFKLGKVAKKVRRKNDYGETRVLTASGRFGLVDQREYFNRSVAGKNLATYYLLENGEFAYNRSAMKGYPFGAIKRLDFYEQGALSTLYSCFGIDGELCDSNFMVHFFEARLLDRQLRRITQVGGRAHGLLNIVDGDFYAMSVFLPSKTEQVKIAMVLDQQASEIDVLERMLESKKQQKKGLMQQLLTGKTRVKVAAEVA